MLTTILFEDFETDTMTSARTGITYTANIADSTSDISNNDYFGVVQPSTGLSTAPKLPSSVAYTSAQGDFYAVQDVDGVPPPVPPLNASNDHEIVLTWSGINVASFTNLMLDLDVAGDVNGNARWDNDDSFVIEVQRDAGGFNKLFAIESEMSGINSRPRIDTAPHDGTGDGAIINGTFTNYASGIANANTLDIRVTITNLDAGDEDFAFDDFRLTGDPVDNPPVLLSFARQTPPTSPTGASSLVFRATFSEDVQNVDVTDFIVNGTTAATITGVTQVSADVYDITVFDLTGFSGAVGVDLAAGQNITDLDGAFDDALPAGEPPVDETYTVDNIAPTLLSFQRKTPVVGSTAEDTVTFRATFDEPVSAVDAADFAANGTTAMVTAVNSISATVFDITISGGDLAGLNGAASLDLSVGQNITDIAGNALPTTEPTTDESYTLVNASAPMTILFEDFEDSTLTYAVSPIDDITDLANENYHGRIDFASLPTATQFTTVASQGNSFFGAQDINSNPPNAPMVVLDWTGIDISTYSNLNLSWLLAEDDDSTNEDWDVNDSFVIEVQLDNGGFVNIFEVTSLNGQTNAAPHVANCVEITDTFQPFSRLIANGTTLDIRVTLDGLTNGDEDIAFDNLSLTGDLVDNPPVLTSLTRQTPAANPTNANSLVFRAAFSEDVQNVNVSDFVVSGGTTATIANVTQISPDVYDITVSGGDLAGFSGIVGVDLASGQDIADLDATADPLPSGEPAIDETYTLDNLAPTLTSFTRQSPTVALTNADSLVFQANFSDPVSGVDTTDFSVNGSTATVTAVTPIASDIYDITVSGGDLMGLNGTVGLDLVGSQNITDLLGNALPNGEPATDETYLLDNMAPTLLSFTRQLPTTSPTSDDTLVFRATFSEDVTNVDITDFAPNGTTATVNSITSVSGTVYDILIGGGDLAALNGIVGIDLLSAQDIIDLSGNALPTAEPTADETYTVETNIVINEIDSDSATDGDEFIELYDGGVGNTSLSGTVLVLFNGSTGNSYRSYDLDGFSTDANGYFVIGDASVPNVDLTAAPFDAIGTANSDIQNGEDAVALFADDATSFPNGTAATTANLLDAVVYRTGNDSVTSLQTVFSMVSVDEDANGSKDIESVARNPNGVGSFHASIPTPGAFNTGNGGTLTTYEDIPGSAIFVGPGTSYTNNNDASFGTVVDDGNGQLTYIPAPDYHGADSFTFSFDNGGAILTQTVNVTVHSVADGCQDFFVIEEDTTITDSVAENDGYEGATVYALNTYLGNGSVVVNSDGTFTYTPAADFTGTDQLSYQVTDAFGEVYVFPVTITVNPIADAMDDMAATNEDTPVTGNVSSNDSAIGTPVINNDATNGTVLDLGNGDYEYTPNPDFSGTDSFTYSVNTASDTETATVTIVVMPVLDAFDDSFGLDEDNGSGTGGGGVATTAAFVLPGGESSAGNEDMIFIDSLANNDTFSGPTSYSLLEYDGPGAITVASDGIFSYIPPENYNGSDEFTYVVQNGGETETAKVVFAVGSVNDAPDAADDLFEVGEDTTLTVSATDGLLSNDSDFHDGSPGEDNGPLRIIGHSNPRSGGTLTVDVDGSFIYTPANDFNGEDTFNYIVTDSLGATTLAFAYINVTPERDVAPDSFTVIEDGSNQFNVVLNDAFESTAILEGVTQGSMGLVEFDQSGFVRYTPLANANGTDSFTYTVTAAGTTETETVRVTIRPINDLFTSNTIFAVREDSPLADSLVANNSTNSGGTLSYALESDPLSGTVTVNSDGSFNYLPDPDFHGEDEFRYVISDPASNESLSRTAFITVGQVDDPAEFSGSFFASTNEDVPASGILMFTDTTDGDSTPSFDVASTDQSANGTAVVDTITGEWTYTPSANFIGEDSFTVSATDDDGNRHTQVISIEILNVPDLTAEGESISATEDMQLLGTVANNDSTTSGGELSYGLVNGTANGTLSLNSDGTFTYTPANHFFGSDSFDYRVFDRGSDEFATLTASISVEASNDPGQFTGDLAQSIEEDSLANGQVAFADSIDGDTAIEYTISDASNGVAAIDSTTGEWEYTPSANYHGSDSFLVFVNDDDGHLEQREVVITVTPLVDLTADDDNFSIDEDTQLVGNVGENDSTESGGTLEFSRTGETRHGTLSLTDDGAFTYSPNENFSGVDSFSYSVLDATSGESANHTVRIVVAGVDDEGFFDGDLEGVGDAGSVIAGTVSFTDAIDGDSTTQFAISGSLLPQNGFASIDAMGNWQYTPTEEFIGPDTFAVVATDDAGNAQLQQIFVTVQPAALPCDLVGDGDGCDINDLDALYANAAESDQPITESVLNQWLSAASNPHNPLKASTGDTYVLGDVNLDGRVDSDDLAELLNDFGGAQIGWGNGDLNGDSIIDSGDLGIVLNNFGRTSEPTPVDQQDQSVTVDVVFADEEDE